MMMGEEAEEEAEGEGAAADVDGGRAVSGNALVSTDSDGEDADVVVEFDGALLLGSLSAPPVAASVAPVSAGAADDDDDDDDGFGGDGCGFNAKNHFRLQRIGSCLTRFNTCAC